jgi:hypothetical protein
MRLLEFKMLVPYTPCPVMRQGLIASFLFLFRQVVQEKVEEDSVDFCVGLYSEDLPAEQLDRPYTAS